MKYIINYLTPIIREEEIEARSEFSAIEEFRKDNKHCAILDGFTCNNSTATYEFKIEVYPEGGAYIYLSPSYADRIGYKGVYSREE